MGAMSLVDGVTRELVFASGVTSAITYCCAPGVGTPVDTGCVHALDSMLPEVESEGSGVAEAARSDDQREKLVGQSRRGRQRGGIDVLSDAQWAVLWKRRYVGRVVHAAVALELDVGYVVLPETSDTRARGSRDVGAPVGISEPACRPPG